VFYRTLFRIYEKMFRLGWTKSQREFSRVWLGRGETYMNDFAVKDRWDVVVSEKTRRYLEARVRNMASLVPRALSDEFEFIEREVRESKSIADFLRR